MNGESTIKSLIWKFMERGGLQIVQFLVSLVLARLLSPAEYGIVSIISIFTTLSMVFVQSGLGTALIQKKNINELELSSVFYYSLFFAIFLCLLLSIFAGNIADFYNMQDLRICLPVMSLVLFPGAYNTVQNALVARKMLFNKQFFSSMIAAIMSGGIGIIFALLDFGVWALIAQQLSYQILNCIILSFSVKWHPQFLFSFSSTKQLLKFGSRLLFATLTDTLFHNLESLVIGKKFSGSTLALYDKGKMFALVMINNLDGAIQTVMLPIYSKQQDQIEVLKKNLRMTISLTTFLTFPTMMGLLAVSKPLILLMLGDKWESAIPFMQIYCVTASLFPLQTANLQVYNAIGKSNIYFKCIFQKRIFSLIVLLLAVILFDSVYAIAFSTILFEVIGIIILICTNTKYLSYSFVDICKDVGMNIVISILMVLFIHGLSIFNINNQMLLLLIDVISGALFYVFFSVILKNPSYIFFMKILKRKFKIIK